MNGIPESQKSESVPDVSQPIGTEKKCGKCGKIKPVTEFYKDRKIRDGFRSWCKKCGLENSKKWKHANPEKCREQEKRYRSRWRKANPEKHREQCKRWCEANPEKDQKRKKAWRQANREKKRKSDAEHRSTPKGNLNNRMSGAIRRALRDQKAGRSWESLVGYTVHDLIKHLEKQFTEGMSWENIGEWHVDHIVPISAFNYKTAEDIDFKKCWALKNLQPLWAKENIRKNAKLEKPFQPSLAFRIGPEGMARGENVNLNRRTL